MNIVWKNTSDPDFELYRCIFETKYLFKFRSDRFQREFVLRNIESAVHGRYSNISAPIWVGVKLTNRCNLSCKHCWTENKNYSPSLDEIKLMLDKLYHAHVKFIGFSGGELFIRKDILEILKYAKSKNFIIELFTNGTLITSTLLDSLERILDKKVDVIQISLDGISEYSIKEQRGLSSANRILWSIEEFIKRGYIVRISYVVTNTNIEDVVPTFCEIDKMGASGFSVSAVYPILKGVEEHKKLDMTQYYRKLYEIINIPHKTELQFFLQIDFFERVSHYIEDLSVETDHNGFLECGFASWFIDANGNVYPEFQLCYEELMGGNIYHDSISSIVQKFSSIKLLSNGRSLQNTDCAKCIFEPLCLRHSYDQAFEKYRQFNYKNPYCKMR